MMAKLPLHKYFYGAFNQFYPMKYHNIKGRDFVYYHFTPTIEDLALVDRIAQLKSQQTMNANQNAESRSQDEKISKQFEGDLAELAVAKLLINVIGLSYNEVKWWDVERTTFETNNNTEYDVKIQRGDKEIKINVRASFYKERRDIKHAFDTDKMDYIPKYVNSGKPIDKFDNVSIRVIYSFSEDYKKSHNDIDYRNLNFYDSLSKRNVEERLGVYVLGFAPTSLFTENSREKNLGQQNTNYETIHLYEGESLSDLKEWIDSHLYN